MPFEPNKRVCLFFPKKEGFPAAFGFGLLGQGPPGDFIKIFYVISFTFFCPCFDETDLFYGMQDIPVIMSYCPEQVLRIGEEYYLTGPMIFFRMDDEGSIVSLTVDDLYKLAEFLEEHTVILMTGPESFVGIRLD